METRLLSRRAEWRRLLPAADLVFADALAAPVVREARPRRLRELRLLGDGGPRPCPQGAQHGRDPRPRRARPLDHPVRRRSPAGRGRGRLLAPGALGRLAGAPLRHDARALPAPRGARRAAAGARGAPPGPARARGGRAARSRGAPIHLAHPRARARDASCSGRRCTATSPRRPRRSLDLADTLLAHRRSRSTGRSSSGLTLLMVPMLNPDGAERYARRNAQGIDVNRDALHLATPEGRVLKAVRDRFQPELGFNLHDQNRRTTVGDTGVLATIALLAVSGDPEGTVTPGRARAKRVCSAVARALAPLRAGRDRPLRRGLEPARLRRQPHGVGHAGGADRERGVPRRPRLADLTRLNYVALLTALHGLARDDLAGETPDLYEGLERNDDGHWTRRRCSPAAASCSRGRASPTARTWPSTSLDRRPPLAASCADPGSPGRSHPRGGRRPAARSGPADRRGGPPAGPRVLRLRARARGARVADRRGARRRRPARRGPPAWHVAAGGAARGAGARGGGRPARPAVDRRRGRGGPAVPPGARRRARSTPRRPASRRRSTRSPAALALARRRPPAAASSSASWPGWARPSWPRSLRPGRPGLASRPAPARAVAPSTPTASTIEAVFLDGREPGAAR